MFFFIQNPFMLLGLLATAVPILLHLQKRRSAKTVRFPSLELLDSIHRKKRFSLKLRELLLLVLRTALILFLVLALSGMQWERKGAVTPESLSLQYVPKQVFLMDTSYSMGYREGGTTRLQKAAAAAQALLDQSRAGQSFLVLPFSDGIDSEALRAISFETNVDKVREALEHLKPTGEKTSVLKALRRISELFDDTYQNRIWIFSDLQESGWNEIVRVAATDEALFRNIPETIVVPVDTGSTENFYLQREPASVGLPKVLGEAFPLTLSAVSSGFPPDQRIPLTMNVEGAVRFQDGSTIPCSVYDKRTRLIGDDRQELEVPLVPLGNLPDLGNRRGIEFSFWEGSANLEVEADMEDFNRLPFDNAVRWNIPVLWNLPVLLIETSVPEVPTRVLRVCLDPFGEEEPFFIRPESNPVGDITLDRLHQFPVVVLQENVWAEMSVSGREALLRYVREGGGLVAFVGGEDDTDLTQTCGVTARPAAQLTEPLTLSALKGNDPVSASLRFFMGDDLSPVYIYSAAQLDGLDRVWMEAESGPSSAQVRVHLPVMGEKGYGKGTCVFLGTGLDSRKSDLASSVLFLPLLHQTLKYLIRDKVPESKAGGTPEGVRSESILRSLGDEVLAQLAQDTGLIVLKKDAPMVGKRRVDLSVPLFWLVVALALAELWIGNRRL